MSEKSKRNPTFASSSEEKLILSMPFKRFEDMGFMHHTKYLGTIKLDENIRLDENEIRDILDSCVHDLEKYFGE